MRNLVHQILKWFPLGKRFLNFYYEHVINNPVKSRYNIQDWTFSTVSPNIRIQWKWLPSLVHFAHHLGLGLFMFKKVEQLPSDILSHQMQYFSRRGASLIWPYRTKFWRKKILAEKKFRRTKFLEATRNFGSFVRWKFFIGFSLPHTICKKNTF